MSEAEEMFAVAMVEQVTAALSSRRHALASLRRAVWEVSLFLDREQVVRFVDDVLREVESDEP